MPVSLGITFPYIQLSIPDSLKIPHCPFPDPQYNTNEIVFSCVSLVLEQSAPMEFVGFLRGQKEKPMCQLWRAWSCKINLWYWFNQKLKSGDEVEEWNTVRYIKWWISKAADFIFGLIWALLWKLRHIGLQEEHVLWYGGALNTKNSNQAFTNINQQIIFKKEAVYSLYFSNYAIEFSKTFLTSQ